MGRDSNASGPVPDAIIWRVGILTSPCHASIRFQHRGWPDGFPDRGVDADLFA